MNRIVTLSALLLVSVPLFAGSGGPDSYGYTWKDSDEPDGPVYSWIDITTTGTLVTGLGDDNIVGPFTMDTDHPFYWYGRKNVWIASNGYIAFNDGNIASPFPIIPTAGGVNDYIAAFTSDLTFAGDGTTARCYFFDDSDITIISYHNVPFWTAVFPGTTGDNTFQIILNKQDSTITIQYQFLSGLTQNNDVLIGIESVVGSVGLQHSIDTYPPSNFAIRFYPPVESELMVTDAAMNWNTRPGNGGEFLIRNGEPLALVANVQNTGNVDLSDFTVNGEVRNAANQVQVSGSAQVPFVLAIQDVDVDYGVAFDPTTAGTYRYASTITGISGELASVNNAITQELVVVDTLLAVRDLKFTGATDDGVGLGWDGGNGGVAMYIKPPYYPAFASATLARIASTTGVSGYSMKVYDDNGLNGTPGILLDSVTINAADVLIGDQVIPLNSPLTITGGGVYVLWYMNGPGINIAEDIVAPFSLQTYEVLGNYWARYRDRENGDFHIGIRLTQTPVYDIGVNGFFGIAAGQEINGPITVRAWVTNYGNQPATGFPVSYRFGNGTPVTQQYTGPAIQPQAQSLVNFTTLFNPITNATDNLCAWSNWSLDMDQVNDTTCVSVNAIVGIQERDAQQLRIWPNPAQDLVFLDGFGTGRGVIEVVDVNGRLVRTERIASGSGRILLHTYDLNPGIYLLRVHQDEAMYLGRFVVQR